MPRTPGVPAGNPSRVTGPAGIPHGPIAAAVGFLLPTVNHRNGL
jgi:hypothetical protein